MTAVRSASSWLVFCAVTVTFWAVCQLLGVKVRATPPVTVAAVETLLVTCAAAVSPLVTVTVTSNSGLVLSRTP